jgi:hypothetical protein
MDRTTTRTDRWYRWLAPLPPALWLLGLLYPRQLESWGAWGAAAPVLIPALVVSAALGSIGLVLVVRALLARRPAGGLVLATLLSASAALYYAWRGVR